MDLAERCQNLWLPIIVLNGSLKGGGTCLGHRVILIARAAAYADPTHDLPVCLQWNPASEDHDLAVVGGMNPKELPARFGVRGQVLCRNVERARRICLFLRDIDTPEPRSIHTNMRDDIPTSICDGDVHWLSNL